MEEDLDASQLGRYSGLLAFNHGFNDSLITTLNNSLGGGGRRWEEEPVGR